MREISRQFAATIAAAAFAAVLLAGCTGGGERAQPAVVISSAIEFHGPPAPPRPLRVVTLAPSLTEAVIAFGAAERLVGVTRFDDAPEVARLPRVGGFVDPSVEAVLALRPDLVLVSPAPGNKAAVERMALLGAPVAAIRLETEREILDGLEALGAALGMAEQGRALKASTEARLARVAERAKALPKVRTLLIYDWEPLVVAGPGSFSDALLVRAGGLNAATEARSAWPVYSAELAMRAAPELLIDAANIQDPARERLLALPGLKEARVAISTHTLFRPGPKLADAVEELFDLLHPPDSTRAEPR